eukprot:COSAG04_NODE_26023_length_300_cov_1.019900_1_plen_80_part_10
MSILKSPLSTAVASPSPAPTAPPAPTAAFLPTPIDGQVHRRPRRSADIGPEPGDSAGSAASLLAAGAGAPRIIRRLTWFG